MMWLMQKSVLKGLGIFLLLPLSLFSGPAQAFEPARHLTVEQVFYMPPQIPNANERYRFVTRDEKLKGALRFFAVNAGIAITISDQVPDTDLVQVPDDLTYQGYLDYLTEKYHLVWFFDGATLFIDTENQLQQKVIGLQKTDGQEIVKVLRNLSIFQPKFMFRYDTQNRVLMVAGPPAYVGQVEDTVKAAEAAKRTETALLRGSGSGRDLMTAGEVTLNENSPISGVNVNSAPVIEGDSSDFESEF